jgi:hypothetical protein
MYVSVNGQIMTAAAYNILVYQRGLQPLKYVTPAMAAHFGYIGTNARGELVRVAPEQSQAV